ncbi:MAG: glycosyltransferase family 39 protein, partial [Planctomycetota bacterium]
PPIDRDEARFAQASRQMFESLALPQAEQDPARHAGGLVVPMVQDAERLNKPPLIYWLQTASAWALTRGDPAADAIWMYRLPSVFGSMLAVLATWRIGLSMFDRRAAWLGAALLGVSAVVVFDAHQARADQVLLGLTTAAMAALWAVARRSAYGRRVGPWRWLALWLLVGLGLLVKGLSPVVVLLTITAFCAASGSWSLWRSAKPLLGLLIVAVVAAPWIVGVINHVGWETYSAILFDETVARGKAPKEGHAGPPGYHTLMLLAAFWPGSLLVAPGLVRGWRRAIAFGPRGSRWRGRVVGRRAELFLLAWILPTWVFFEVYSTKLPHYVLPTYPAIALLTGRAALSVRAWAPAWLRRVNAAMFLAVAIAVAVVGVLATQIEIAEPPALALVLPLAAVFIALAGAGAALAWQGRRVRGLAIGASAILPLAVVVHAVVLPRLTSFSPELVAMLAEFDDGSRPIACAGYHEDSLIFLTRGRIERVRHTDAADWLRENPGGLMLARRLYKAEGGLGDSPVLASATGYQFASNDVVIVDFIERVPR